MLHRMKPVDNACTPSDVVVDPIYSPKVTKAYLSLSLPTIWRLRRRGQFPAPLRLSVGRIGWPKSALDEWRREREAAAR